MLQKEVTNGLIIAQPWIGKILSGEKMWEMRSTNTKIRGPFALIEKGTGTIVGTASLKEVLGPFDDNGIVANQEKHRVTLDQIGKWRYAWVLEDVARLETPIHYKHRSGAVKWVKLS